MQPEAALLGMRATQRAPAGGTSLTAACQHHMGSFLQTFLIKVDLGPKSTYSKTTQVLSFLLGMRTYEQIVCRSKGQFSRISLLAVTATNCC